MATPITITQAPSDIFNFAYGPVPITLDGLSINWDKYVLRVYPFGSNTPIADVRQAPNTNGMAIFDLRNILQSQVGPIEASFEETMDNSLAPFIRIGGPEQFRYQIAIGYQQGNNAPVMNSSGGATVKYGPYQVLAGATYEYDINDSIASIVISTINGNGSNPTCTQSIKTAQPLTDSNDSILAGSTGDDFATRYNYNGNIFRYNKYDTDDLFTTWYQKLQRNAPLPDVKAQGIEAWDVVEYDSNNTHIATNTVPNTTGYGGGPNINIGDGTAISGPYSFITFGSGPSNLPANLNANTAYYYVVPLVYTPCPDGQQQFNVSDFPVADPVRVNIIEPDCNDFRPVQFSWINSWGYKDTFTFTKKFDRQINQNNNTYLQEYADYASTNYSVNTYDRGNTVYSQSMKQVYTVQSRFMSDKEAEFLRSLFRSADVKVQLSASGPWYAAKLVTTSWTQKTARTDKLFQYTVSFEIPQINFNMRG